MSGDPHECTKHLHEGSGVIEAVHCHGKTWPEASHKNHQNSKELVFRLGCAICWGWHPEHRYLRAQSTRSGDTIQAVGANIVGAHLSKKPWRQPEDEVPCLRTRPDNRCR